VEDVVVDELPMFEKKNPYYAFKHLLIKINFHLSDIKENSLNSPVQYAEFIHELTHYLQSFSTVNGICSMISYLEAIESILEKLPQKIVKNSLNFKELISEQRERFEGSKNRLYWETECLDNQNNTIKPEYKISMVFNPVFKKENKEIFINNIIDGKYYHISTRVLRENMAQMVTFFVRGIGDDAILDYVKTNKVSYHYWLLFSYFLYNYPKIEDKRIFTFYFCELILSTQNIGESLDILLEEINKEYSSGCYNNCYQILDELKKKHSEKLNTVLLQIESFINVISNKYLIKSRSGQFYSILNKIMKALSAGITFRKTHSTIFNANDIMTGVWVNNMSSIFLSPIINSPNGEFRVLFNDQDFINEMFVFFAVTIIIDLYLGNEEIIDCPFCKQIPICDEYKKNNDTEQICLNNPFYIKKFDDGGCAFYNACLILGLLPDEELRKYII
jgi:hypothetical protein